MKVTWETETATVFGAPGTMTPARHAESDVCRWIRTAIRDMTMLEAELALAADPLFHVECDGHLGRVDLRYWYFRPELKYLTCRECSEGGNPSPIGPAAVSCQHRIPTK